MMNISFVNDNVIITDSYGQFIELTEAQFNELIAEGMKRNFTDILSDKEYGSPI